MHAYSQQLERSLSKQRCVIEALDLSNNGDLIVFYNFENLFSVLLVIPSGEEYIEVKYLKCFCLFLLTVFYHHLSLIPPPAYTFYKKSTPGEKRSRTPSFALIFDLNYFKRFYIFHEINDKWLFCMHNKKSIFMLWLKEFRHYYSVNLTQGASTQSDLKPKHLAYVKD